MGFPNGFQYRFLNIFKTTTKNLMDFGTCFVTYFGLGYEMEFGACFKIDFGTDFQTYF